MAAMIVGVVDSNPMLHAVGCRRDQGPQLFEFRGRNENSKLLASLVARIIGG